MHVDSHFCFILLQDLSPAVQKLEGQLAVTKSALLAHQEQLKDLNSQVYCLFATVHSVLNLVERY
jgi:phage-related tail protein